MANKIVNGFIWTSIERFGSQAVQIILNIIIARFVTPADYGILGLLFIFLQISQLFIDSGFGSALIQKNKINKQEIKSVFTFNFFVSIIMYLILFSSSTFFEDFYQIQDFHLYLETIISVLIINCFIIIPTAVLKINLDFKSLAIANFTTSIVSGLIGVILAYNGFGVWALVWQTLSRSFILAIILIFRSKWIPILGFNINDIKTLIPFSIRIFFSSCINTIVDDIASFFIGKTLNAKSLGLYSRSKQFAIMPYNTIGMVIVSVLFPSLSSIKDNREKLLSTYKKSINYQAMISIPIHLWMAMLASPVIILLLTEKWSETIILLQIFCIGRIFILLPIVTEQSLNAIGRSDLYFKNQIWKMGIKMILFFISLPFGLIWIVISEASFNFIQFFITNSISQKELPYSIHQQLKDIKIYLIAGIISSLLGFVAIKFVSITFIAIIISITLAISSYITILYLSPKKQELILIVNTLINKKK